MTREIDNFPTPDEVEKGLRDGTLANPQKPALKRYTRRQFCFGLGISTGVLTGVSVIEYIKNTNSAYDEAERETGSSYSRYLEAYEVDLLSKKTDSLFSLTSQDRKNIDEIIDQRKSFESELDRITAKKNRLWAPLMLASFATSIVSLVGAILPGKAKK